MSGLPSRLVRLREGLAAGQGVLFIGPDFAHGLDALDVGRLLDELGEDLDDRSGWDGLDLHDRLTLAAQALGDDGLARALGERLPSGEVLPDSVCPFHRRLLGLPFPTVVDCTLGDFVETAFRVIDPPRPPQRVLADDDDLVLRPDGLPGERTLVKLRGDLLLGEALLTPTRLAELPRKRPALFARLEAAARRGPVMFYGFGPRDPVLRWLVDALAPISGTAVLAMCLQNTLWRRHWADRGFEVIDAPDVALLEVRVDRLLDALDPRAEQTGLEALMVEASALVRRSLGPSAKLAWAHLDPAALEAIAGEAVDDVRDGLTLLAGLAERGLPIPAAPPALAAEILQRAHDLPGARRALALAAQALGRAGFDGTADVDVVAAGAIGRALSRMGDPDRARGYLELALNNGDLGATAARADELAWLCRCVLDRVDRLRAKKRHRALMELVATFLAHQAHRLMLARVEPGDDEGLMWSVYYINLRLGRLMGLASEMADEAGEVYANQAVELLIRAIELAPFKPDAYKFVRPLLTDRRSSSHDPRRWMALVASAPPAV